VKMNSVISPRLRKLFAATLLVVVLWALLQLISFYTLARLNLSNEIADLRERYFEIAGRRVDTEILEAQLRSVLASPQVRRATITVGNEREVLNRLMQIARGSLERSQANLLSLIQSPVVQGSSGVAVQLRARMHEQQVWQWLASVDESEVRLQMQEFTVASATEMGAQPGEIEINATLRTPWIKEQDHRP
jgi:hypothetical protein